MAHTTESKLDNLKILEHISDAAFLFEKDGSVGFQNKASFSAFGQIDNFWNYFALDPKIHPELQNFSQTNSVNLKHKLHFKEYNFNIQLNSNHSFFAIIQTEKTLTEDINLRHTYYQIGNLTKTTKNLEELLSKIHALLIDQMQAHNMTVCIDNQETNCLDFIYYFDEEFGGQKKSYSREKTIGLNEYILKTKTAHLLYAEDIIELKKKKILDPIGTIPKIWIGVPMIYNDHLIGVLSVKSHSNRKKFTQEDLEFLQFITIQISFGIERKIYEDRITDQSARLRSIFESGNQLIWSVNKKRQLTSFNENYAKVIEQLHGIRPEIEANKNKILLLSAGEFTELIKEKYNLAFEGISQQYETSFVETDGTTTWRQMFLSPIYSSDGKINQISGIAHDITDKKLNELAVSESEKKFRQIFETLQDIYIKFNGRDEIEIISPSVMQITGFEQDELIGKNVRDFFVPKNEGDLELLKNLLNKDKSVKNFELNLVTKSGELIPSIANLDAVLNNHNKTIGVQGVIRDIYELQTITEELKKAKIEAEHSLKVKENFLANMSHEIRTPMNGIVAMIDMIKETKLNRLQNEYINTVQESSHVLMKILNDILDLSKLEAGKMEFRKENVSVKEILQKAFLLFSQKAKSKKIIFNYYSDPKIPKYVISDETRLIQILLNLISNAIKFTDFGGEVSVTATLIEDFEHFSCIKFVISDTGIGIDETEIEKLFKSFNQADSSITKKYGGTGLGLSISKELCNLLGGDIEVRSIKGKGSSFFFTLNTPKFNLENENNLSNISYPIETRNLKKLKVLVVDDNDVNRKVCMLLLSQEKAEIHFATNGKEAIQQLESNKFDAVLMDIQMPIMDGVAALQEINNRNLRKKAKIIALTAYSMEEDKEKFLSMGFDSYLAKPITRDRLIQSILDLPKEQEPKETYIINKETKQNIVKIGGEALYLELLQDFNIETKELIQEIKIALGKRDWKSIHLHAHQIKGSAGSLGLDKLYNLAHTLEQETLKNNSAAIFSFVDDLLKEYENFVIWHYKLLK